jgi:putative addiction module component (TIGR02574 family)
MGNPARAIFSAALDLPQAERLELASRLIASVDGPDEPEWEAAWEDEVDRREHAAQAGPAAREPGAPWSQVRGRVLERLPR